MKKETKHACAPIVTKIMLTHIIEDGRARGSYFDIFATDRSPIASFKVSKKKLDFIKEKLFFLTKKTNNG